jgi:hypothetical protein
MADVVTGVVCSDDVTERRHSEILNEHYTIIPSECHAYGVQMCLNSGADLSY